MSCKENVNTKKVCMERNCPAQKMWTQIKVCMERNCPAKKMWTQRKCAWKETVLQRKCEHKKFTVKSSLAVLPIDAAEKMPMKIFAVDLRNPHNLPCTVKKICTQRNLRKLHLLSVARLSPVEPCNLKNQNPLYVRFKTRIGEMIEMDRDFWPLSEGSSKAYLIFVFFSPQAQFLVKFFSTQKRVNQDKTDFATK